MYLTIRRKPARSLSRRRSHHRAVQARPLDLGLPHRCARHGGTELCRPLSGSRTWCRSNTEILNFKPTDYLLKPFKADFFHLNPRHHSLAFIDTGKNGIHHMMFEVCYLDDVGQAYDLALRQPEMIGTTLGRHANDQVTSFYSYSPSKFLVEYGWGGRSIDSAKWTPDERTEGPSLWDHDGMWLTPEKREEARSIRVGVAE